MFYNIPSLETLVSLHNEIREGGGWFRKPLPPLIKHKELFKYAQEWVEHIAEIDNLKHGNIESIMSLGFSMAAENIAFGQQTEQNVMSTWIKSYGHKKNILNKHYDSIGCGFAYSDKGKPYWVVCFGKRLTGK